MEIDTRWDFNMLPIESPNIQAPNRVLFLYFSFYSVRFEYAPFLLFLLNDKFSIE